LAVNEFVSEVGTVVCSGR